MWNKAISAHGPDRDGHRSFLDLDGRSTGLCILPALDGHDVNNIIVRLDRESELNVGLTGHSLRAGLATEARRAGHDAKAISQHARFTEDSTVVQRYLRQADEFGDRNAPASIGL